MEGRFLVCEVKDGARPEQDHYKNGSFRTIDRGGRGGRGQEHTREEKKILEHTPKTCISDDVIICDISRVKRAL